MAWRPHESGHPIPEVIDTTGITGFGLCRHIPTPGRGTSPPPDQKTMPHEQRTNRARPRTWLGRCWARCPVITGRPLVRIAPRSPPPGPIETAVGLLLGHAFGPLRPRPQRLIAATLLGTGGHPPPSVATVAASANLSIPRVNQLRREARGIAAAAGSPASLLAAMKVLAEGPVLVAADAAAANQAAGHTTNALHPSCLIQVARLFGAPPPAFAVLRHGAVDMVIPDRLVPAMAALRHDLRRLAYASTMVDLTLAAPPGVSAAACAAVLGADPRWTVHLQPLDDGQLRWWAWLRHPAAQIGVVAAQCLRLLTAQPRPLTQLHAATTAALQTLPPYDRRAATVPPAAVLNSWLLEQRHTREHDGILTAVTPLTNRLDDALLAVIPTGGGSVNRAQLRAALTAVGYTDASAATLVGRSPVIQRCDHDTYIAR